MPTSLERTRRHLGLSQPQILQLLGAKMGRLSLLYGTDADVDPIFLQRARRLLCRYTQWKARILSEVTATSNERGFCTMTDLARILGCDRSLLYQMHARGVLLPPRAPGRRGFVVTPSFVEDFFTVNESTADQQVCTDHAGRSHRLIRGPLADLFLRELGFQYRAQQRRSHPLRASA